MAIKLTAVFWREIKVNPKKPNDRDRWVALQLLNENGEKYGGVALYHEFREVGNLLERAGVTHEQLQDCSPRYEKGEEVRISLTFDDEDAIARLGFGSEAA